MLELNKIHLVDCIEGMGQLDDNSCNLCFTSPPYNCGNKGKNKDMYKFYGDNLPDDEYYNLLNNSLKQMLRVCSGPIFVNLNYVKNNTQSLYRFVSDNSQYLLETIIWDKETCQPPIGNILGKRFEFIFLFAKDKFELNCYGRNAGHNKGENYKNIFGNWISNLIKVPKDDTKNSKVHRAGFPVSLPKVFIDIYTKPNDVILDPFMGTGSTAVAATDIGRRFVGFELSPEYVEISNKRIEEAKTKLVQIKDQLELVLNE